MIAGKADMSNNVPHLGKISYCHAKLYETERLHLALCVSSVGLQHTSIVLTESFNVFPE